MALALKRDDGYYLYHHTGMRLLTEQLDLGCVFTEVRDYVEKVRMNLEQSHRWEIILVDVEIKESSSGKFRYR